MILAGYFISMACFLVGFAALIGKKSLLSVFVGTLCICIGASGVPLSIVGMFVGLPSTFIAATLMTMAHIVNSKAADK